MSTFQERLTVEKQELDEKIGKLQEKLQQAKTPDEAVSLQGEIIKLQQEAPNLGLLIYTMNDILMTIWEHNQTMKGAKKERLFLAGAEQMTAHLFKISCPYDA